MTTQNRPAGPRAGMRRRAAAAEAPVVIDAPGLPSVIRANHDRVHLPTWIGCNRDQITELLHASGAVLFEGFGADADIFDEAIRALSGSPMEDPARYDLGGPKDRIYVTTRYPNELNIYMHNETWWQHEWPKKLYFCCQIRPATGGATSLADCRKVLDAIPADVREAFEPGVLMVRNFGTSIGLRPWQEVFRTNETRRVEEACRRFALEWEWGVHNTHLQTRHIRPTILTHPVTGEAVWFNHIAHGHISVNTTRGMRDSVAALSRDELPMNTYYANGDTISDDTMTAIRQAYDHQTVNYPWDVGNLLIVDNELAAHGRQAFTGERKVLAALAEPSGWPQ